MNACEAKIAMYDKLAKVYFDITSCGSNKQVYEVGTVSLQASEENIIGLALG